jgi:hypothetical protein
MMTEWHIPFDHIDNNWTCRQVESMWARLVERKQKEANDLKQAKEKNASKR